MWILPKACQPVSLGWRWGLQKEEVRLGTWTGEHSWLYMSFSWAAHVVGCGWGLARHDGCSLAFSFLPSSAWWSCYLSYPELVLLCPCFYSCSLLPASCIGDLWLLTSSHRVTQLVLCVLQLRGRTRLSAGLGELVGLRVHPGKSCLFPGEPTLGVHSYTFVCVWWTVWKETRDQHQLSFLRYRHLMMCMCVFLSLCLYRSMCSCEDKINVEYPSVHSPS